MTGDNRDAALVHSLAAQVETALANVLSQGQPVALVDFPHHNNYGDTAIWAGELAALSRGGHEVRYASDDLTFSASAMRKQLGSHGAVLLHGGGSFGDIWPDRQNFREQVIAACDGLPVVQMPQTVTVRNEDAFAAMRRLIQWHGAVTVMVRDAASRRTVDEALGIPAVLVPDAAFALGPLHARPSRRSVVWLARTDHERLGSSSVPADADDVLVVDWFTRAEHRRASRFAVRTRVAAATSLARHAGLRHASTRPWQAAFAPISRARLARAVTLLSEGRVIVTDRLHGHILATLLGRPHVLLDTADGKVTRFHETFTQDSHLAHLATDGHEALRLARELSAA